NSCCPLVTEYPAIVLAHVLAVNDTLHERIVLRFRLLVCRRARLGTPSVLGRLPAAYLALGPRCQGFCFINAHRDHPSYSRYPLFGPSPAGSHRLAAFATSYYALC